MRFTVASLSFLTLLGCSLHAQNCLTEVQTGIGGTISHLQPNTPLTNEFDRQLVLVSSAFHVYPAFFLADDSRGPNAMAFDCGVVPGTNSTVVFGALLTQQQFAASGPFMNYSIPAIIAHEFTHIVQDERNVHPPGAGTELQADYMAGWYTARVNQYSRDRMNAIRQSISSFYKMGDSAIDPTDTDPHGLSSQRAAAIQAGMSVYRVGFEDAWKSSQVYISSIANIPSGFQYQPGSTSANTGQYSHPNTLNSSGSKTAAATSATPSTPWPLFVQLAENDDLMSLKGEMNDIANWNVSSAPTPFLNGDCYENFVSESDTRFRLNCEREISPFSAASEWIDTRVALFKANGASETARKQRGNNTYAVILRTSHGAEVVFSFQPRNGDKAAVYLVITDK